MRGCATRATPCNLCSPTAAHCGCRCRCTMATQVHDFYAKEVWAGHPTPYADFVAFKQKERAELEADCKKLVRP